jgi:hypothetical protein
LNDGYVYIGLEYQDPITAPTGAFWDEAFTIPADQPLRTSGGYIVRNGSPAAVYTGASYSILVQNKNLVTVYNAPSAVITNVTNTVEDITQYQGAHATDPIARNDGTPLQVGDLYFNTVVNELKVWSGSTWVPASPGSVTVENFTGTGSQTAFNLATAPVAENNTQIYIDGVYQQKDTYAVSGATVNFTTAPPLNSEIEVVSFSIASLGTIDASNVSYNEGGTGAVNTSVQSKLQETVSVKDFGAVGDGVTDDSVAIQAAIDSIEPGGSAKRGTVYFPPGNYRTTQMLTINGTSVGLKGDSGELCTTITGDFTGTGVADSAIIKINGRYCYVKNIAFSASATREAATNVHAHAIWIEADDNGTADSNHGVYQSLFIEKQPGDGIVGIAKIWNTTFDNIRVRDCKGHGFCFDNGTKTSRTNEANPGEVIINNCQVFDNGGHALLIGNTNENHNRGFRFQVNNFDAYRNAESAGVRITADQIWAFCDTTRFESCAVDGFNQAESSVVTNGIKILGQNIGIYNTRFLNVLAHAVTVDEQLTFPTFGIIIENIYLYANTPVQLDPVVNVSSSVQDVKVSLLNPLTSNQAAPVSTTLGIPLDKRAVVSSKSATQTICNTTTLVDVTDMKVVLLPKERVQFRFSILYRGDSTADIKFQFTRPSGANIAWAPVNSIYIGTSDAISIKDVNFGSVSTIQCGCNNSNQTRIIELVGEVLTTGTGGDLQLQFAQNVATVNDTEILGQSYAVGYRM